MVVIVSVCTPPAHALVGTPRSKLQSVAASWTALGDSYSSGEGNPPFDPGTNQKNDACRRSKHAYPRVLGVKQERHFACSGDVIRDFYDVRGSGCEFKGDDGRVIKQSPCHPGEAGYKAWLEVPQISQVKSAGRLITLTVGGNDIGFPSIAKDCLLEVVENTATATAYVGVNTLSNSGIANLPEPDAPAPHCKRRFVHDGVDDVNNWITGKFQPLILDQDANVVKHGDSTLRSRLADLYKAILAKSSDAHVIVLGYPRLFAPSNRTGKSPQVCLLSGENRDWVNEKLGVLNNEIVEAVNDARRAQVAAEQSRLQYVDITEAFFGHEICGDSPEFMNDYTAGFIKKDLFGRTQWLNESNVLHPNVLGHLAIASVLAPHVAAVEDADVSTTPTANASSIDMALAIDSSSSMVDNDPKNDRLNAANTYLTASVPGDRVSVVDFDGAAKEVAPLTVLPEGQKTLSDAITKVDSDGDTNIGAGIKASCDSLNDAAAARSRAAMICSPTATDRSPTNTSASSKIGGRSSPSASVIPTTFC